MSVSIGEIVDHVLAKYDGVVLSENWGERALFYNPGDLLPKGVYLLTFKEHDGANDSASNVNRDGVYRLNLGISKSTFIEMFGSVPRRPAAGRTIEGAWDFQKLDRITPHPVYGWMAWIAVLNPSERTFARLKPLLREGYELAVHRFRKRRSQTRGIRAKGKDPG